METTGIVFDIEEFAVYDGPGIRSVIFLKGCPLRCAWCHNPEGLAPMPQRMISHDLCHHCGACAAACRTPEACTACGACVAVCPQRCIRMAGRAMAAGAVAARIGRHARMLKMNGGGITFSGGEALLQPDFVLAVRALLPDLHAAVETCGHAPRAVFEAVVSRMDLVLMDIKHTDDAMHRRYTGQGNALIRENLERLKDMGVPWIARIPLIPGVNDSPANMVETARWLSGSASLVRVELLRYNRAAGAKYHGLGLEYAPGFDGDVAPLVNTAPFEALNMEVIVL